MYTKEEVLNLLLGARKILHKQEIGKEVTNLDVILAHDKVDMVIDAIIQDNVDLDTFKSGYSMQTQEVADQLTDVVLTQIFGERYTESDDITEDDDMDFAWENVNGRMYDMIEELKKYFQS